MLKIIFYALIGYGLFFLGYTIGGILKNSITYDNGYLIFLGSGISALIIGIVGIIKRR